MDLWQTPLPFIAVWAVGLWMLVEGVALSRGAAWAYGVGIPLRWREETLPMPLPQEAIDLSDRLDREGSFDTDDACTAFYLDLDSVGLMYWAMSFGARNTLRIKGLRGLGVLATGMVRIRRGATFTELRWRPVVRLGPLLSLLSISWLVVAQFGSHHIHSWIFMGPGAVYLAMLWWTLGKLRTMYESVSAQLVQRGVEARQGAPR